MTTASRRNTLRIGAAAIVLGPSVVFSRTASATEDIKLAGAFTSGQFTVKIDGVYDQVPGVVSVDLGSVKLLDPATFDRLATPSYTGVKLSFASKDAAKLTVKLAPEYTRKKKGSGKAELGPAQSSPPLKISVSLLAADGKTPAVTYHANNAVPVSIETDMAGGQTVAYDVASVEVVSTPAALNRTRQKELLTLSFNADIEGFGTVAGFSMTKAVYDWMEIKSAPTRIDGVDKASAHRLVNKASLVTFVTSDRIPSALVSRDKPQPGIGKLKFWSTREGAAPPPKDFRFSKALLTSIDFPKLQAGSDALVTETLHFKIESTKG